MDTRGHRSATDLALGPFHKYNSQQQQRPAKPGPRKQSILFPRSWQTHHRGGMAAIRCQPQLVFTQPLTWCPCHSAPRWWLKYPIKFLPLLPLQALFTSLLPIFFSQFNIALLTVVKPAQDIPPHLACRECSVDEVTPIIHLKIKVKKNVVYKLPCLKSFVIASYKTPVQIEDGLQCLLPTPQKHSG